VLRREDELVWGREIFDISIRAGCADEIGEQCVYCYCARNVGKDML